MKEKKKEFQKALLSEQLKVSRLVDMKVRNWAES